MLILLILVWRVPFSMTIPAQFYKVVLCWETRGDMDTYYCTVMGSLVSLFLVSDTILIASQHCNFDWHALPLLDQESWTCMFLTDCNWGSLCWKQYHLKPSPSYSLSWRIFLPVKVASVSSSSECGLRVSGWIQRMYLHGTLGWIDHQCQESF